MRNPFSTDRRQLSSFAFWQRWIAAVLSAVLVLNTGLMSSAVHARSFEVQLDRFADVSPEQGEEFGLVNVIVEGDLMTNASVRRHVQSYCTRVQEAIGVACMVSPWNGETPSRIVEALQQMYFEGVSVTGGLGKLVGLVIVGEVPLPVVHNGLDTFPSFFPYTDLVQPAYFFDSDQGIFIRSSETAPQAEVWHGLIRPPGKGDERVENLIRFFEKNGQFYAGDADLTEVKDVIGFHDQLWENDSFDNETKKWYLKKQTLLDRLMHYRYTGEWLQELSGEAVDRLAQLTARTFDDASVDVEKPSESEVDAELGFDQGAAERSLASSVSALGDDADEDAETKETTPDMFSPGPIRNFLKDYVNTVARYISGVAELLDVAGRRQSHETLSSLITKMDKFHAAVLFLIMQEFEKHIYGQVEIMAQPFELVAKYEELNEFYTEELGDALAEAVGADEGPEVVKANPKGGFLEYGSKTYTRFVNGHSIELVQDSEQCSLERGTNFVTSEGELGKAITQNRKDNPTTAQDIAGVDGADAEDEIDRIYRKLGFCSYQVRDRCVPAAAKRPVFDYGASTLFDGDNDYQRCYNHDGPPAPHDIEEAQFTDIPSALNHNQPTGETVSKMLESKLAHYLPIDAVRHASFYWGGVSQYAEDDVARIRYPNLFEVKATDARDALEEVSNTIQAKELEIRKMRVDANWKRYLQYIGLSSPVGAKPDFWNYNEIPGLEPRFEEYKQQAIELMKGEVGDQGEDFLTVEAYLNSNSNDLSDGFEEQMIQLFDESFPTALDKTSSETLKCSYGYELPPINVDIPIPEPPNPLDAFAGNLTDFKNLTKSLPKFSPPSVTRSCSGQVAKNTVDEAKTLRQFYAASAGSAVQVAILHDPEGFIEIIDPTPVALYLAGEALIATGAPPSVAAGTAMVAQAIVAFDQQIERLENGDQPVTVLNKVITPVRLQREGELQRILARYQQLIFDAVHWLNLSIEGKHREGLSLLARDKEMLYLVMNGDAQTMDFTMDDLKGNFDPDGDNGIASDEADLDAIAQGAEDLAKKQEEARERRAQERREEGERESECGDSVPLLEWPGAVVCWLEELVAGPIIVPADEESSDDSEDPADDAEEAEDGEGEEKKGIHAGPPGKISLSQSVLTLQDRARATVNMPLEVEINWDAQGAVRVVKQSGGEVAIVPEELGQGTITATFQGKSVRETVQVVDRKADLQIVTSNDIQVATDEALDFTIEVRDSDDQLVKISTNVQVEATDSKAFTLPSVVEILDGVGQFSITAGQRAGRAGLHVVGSEVAQSQTLFVDVLAGPPDQLQWDFGDAVLGLDHEINGTLSSHDTFGNAYRAEGLRVELEWDEGITIDGNDSGKGYFFIVAGRLPVVIDIDPELLADDAFGLSYGGDQDRFGNRYDDEDLITVDRGPQIRVLELDGYPAADLPDPPEFDLRQDYRLQFAQLPTEVDAGDRIKVQVRVAGGEDLLSLQYKTFVLQEEMGGERVLHDIEMQGENGFVEIHAPPTAGQMNLIIDDHDFGTVTHSIEVLGQEAERVELDEAEYRDGQIVFTASGRDAYGNRASLAGQLAIIEVIADGAETVFEQREVITDATWDYQIDMERQFDRVRLQIQLQGFDASIQRDLALAQILTTEQVMGLSWETPYAVVLGEAFGDYREDETIAQAMLFGDQSHLQAVTTELAPHQGLQRVARIWPSGRVEPSDQMEVEVVWEALKPVLVFRDQLSEVGRLQINPRQLGFDVVDAPDGQFVWDKERGAGMALLLPEAEYEPGDRGSVTLLSPQGQPVMRISDLNVIFEDPAVETVMIEDFADVLVLEFRYNGQLLAHWYLDMAASGIVFDAPGTLQWRFTGQYEDQYDLERFYAGESTRGPEGLLLLKQGEDVQYSLGDGRSALDDVYNNNGQGFFGQDKSSMNFLAGNSVGESNLLQSEGIVTLGDPVISLRQVKHRNRDDSVTPAVGVGSPEFLEDYSIGQLLYSPDDGTVTHLLRLDVEGDREDDLLVVVNQGRDSVVRYLEGNGEGQRWGSVTDVLRLGEGVSDVHALQGQSLVVQYDSGQVAVESNVDGKYIRSIVDFSVLGAERVDISDMSVNDFDADGTDDLLFLTGDRQLWVWFGQRSVQGHQFGVENEDRLLVDVLSVRLEDPSNMDSAAWLYTESTPKFQTGCERPDDFRCQGRFFKGLKGFEPLVTEEIDFLADLQERAENVEPVAVEEIENDQRHLVRLDKLSRERGVVDIQLLSHQEGAALNLRDQLEFQVTVTPRATEDFVLHFDLGADFRMVGSMACEGCDDEALRLVRAPGVMWSLEGKARAGQSVIVGFQLEYAALPAFSFQVMQTNADRFPDIGINTEANGTGQITVYESRDARDYRKTIFGTPAPDTSSDALSDALRGEGDVPSDAEVRNQLQQQSQVVEEQFEGLLDSFHQDLNMDGYPDVFQENASLIPDQIIGEEEIEEAGPVGISEPDQEAARIGLAEFLKAFVPQASAQFENDQQNVNQNLENTNQMIDDIGDDVETALKVLKCSRGCLPLPINFSFLTPGPINVNGAPAGFDPGLPVFSWGVPSLIPVWPPSPYQATLGGSIYLSPTLTGGLGVGICLGPYLLGQCFVFAVPISQLGGEAVCDSVKQGLESIVQGITGAVGQVQAGVESAAASLNNTGVVKVKNSKNNVEEVESIIGVSLGGGNHNQGVVPVEPKVNLDPIPKTFVDWWDRQWEEIVNSIADLPDITLRLPDFSGAFGEDPQYFDKLGKRFSADTAFSLQQIYDLINSLPIISLKPEVIKLQIPWIEPGILNRIEQSLYDFLNGFMLELLAFFKSFNLPCNITVSRAELFNEVSKKIRGGQSDFDENRIQQLKAELDGMTGNIQRAEERFRQVSQEQGFAKETNEARRDYFKDLFAREKERDRLNKRYEEIEAEIARLQSPKGITDVFAVFVETVKMTSDFWIKQVEEMNQANTAAAVKRESADAIRSCLALDFGADLTTDVSAFVDSIQQVLESLEAWKKFPRQLAKFLNILEFYTKEVAQMVDQLTSTTLKWWSEFEKKLDLWIDVIFAYQEFLALINAIIDILKGYNKKCGLCTSDRLTLKDIILKLLFGAVPEFPILDFPDWPDIHLDFSTIKLGAGVTVPTFDIKQVDLKWPQLPKIKLPRFSDTTIDIDGSFKVGFSIKLPPIPLQIPTPPPLPPLPPLPDLPQINLPNLPPAPEAPEILESLLPLMKIIQTILDIWCLVNKSLIPFDEKQLKTQVENLTNRSGNLILPIDVLMNFNVAPGEFVGVPSPFDLIEVKSYVEAGANIEPIPDVQATIDQQYHQPMNAFINNIDGFMKALRNSIQGGFDSATSGAQGELNKLRVDTDIKVEGPDANLNLSPTSDGIIEESFPELLNYRDAENPTWGQWMGYSHLFDGRKRDLIAQNAALKQTFEQLAHSLEQINQQDPEELLADLARPDADHVLVAGSTPSWLQEYAQEKEAALYDPQNFVEKRLSLVDKPMLIAQVEESGDALQNVQSDLLGTETLGVQDLGGVAVVRNGEVSRVQDYPLDDPVIQVWDDDVLLAYEGSVYLKSDNNDDRRHQEYSGAVLQRSLDQFQRSKVHHLASEPISSDASTSEDATLRWTWEAPGVTDVELTIWDSVAKAQQIDSENLRFYIHLNEPEPTDYFEALTAGLQLVEGQEFLARRDLRLRFGDDLVIIPQGMRFVMPSLILREMHFNGSGTVQLENFSGLPWTFRLEEGISLEMDGITRLAASGEQIVQIPAVGQRPYLRAIDGDVTGALQARVEVLRGEKIPVGLFYPVVVSRVADNQTGAQLTMAPGMTIDITQSMDWSVLSGRGELVVSEEVDSAPAREGMILLDDELLEGSYVVEHLGQQIDVGEEQKVMWTSVDIPAFEVTLPLANYYGRMREAEGKRGYSPIVHGAAAQALHGPAQLVDGLREIRVPIYTPFTVDALQYVIGSLPDDSYIWQLGEDGELLQGTQFSHDGFPDVGEHPLTLFVRNGPDGVIEKDLEIKVFIPDLVIDQNLFEEARVIRVQTDPPVAGVPIGIVGSRDGVEDWLLSFPEEGEREGERYRANELGMVQLQPLPQLDGLNIIKDGEAIGRLFPNSRVVLYPEYEEKCQNVPLLDADGYVKFQVSCIEDGGFKKAFDVRMIPDKDTDVSVVDQFEFFHRGTVIRSLQSSIEILSLPGNSAFAPGGAQVQVEDGESLMVVASDGKIDLVDDSLTIREQEFTDPTEPLIWEVLRRDIPLAEFQIKGPGDQMSIIDPPNRVLPLGDDDNDGLLDSWEAIFNVSDPQADPDNDGLNNLEEFQAATDPLVADSDGDGLKDGEEVNPRSASSAEKKVAFRDVARGSPYFEAIHELAALGFIKGFQDGTFRPDQPVTRAEALKILMSVIRCENCEFPSQATKDEFEPTLEDFNYFVNFHDGQFEDASPDPLKNFAFDAEDVESSVDVIRTYLDVEIDDWFYYCVEIATKIGLVHGYRGFEAGENALGKFIPQRGVNVAELMKMVIEAVGERGKVSDRIYEPAEGWWNDAANNYMAKAEEDLGLLVEAEDYAEPLREATRAEVAFAAYRVLKENGVLDFDDDGVPNNKDFCPCQPRADLSQPGNSGFENGCPDPGVDLDTDDRESARLFEGIEVVQYCDCLVFVPADLFAGSRFFAVITGEDDEDDKVLTRSNEVSDE